MTLHTNEIEKVECQSVPNSLERIQLADNDQTAGELLVEYANLKSAVQSPIVFTTESTSRENTSITVHYTFLDKDWEVVSQGKQVIELIAIPAEFALYQNYPNPFNPITTINYDIPEDFHVKLTIHDITGRQVIQLVNEDQQAGYKSVQWNGRNSSGQLVSAGMYFYTIESGNYSAVRKMVLLK